MIERFLALKTAYASQEVTMDILQEIERSSGFSFINHGVSRVNKNCLACTVIFDPLVTLKSTLVTSNQSVKDFHILMKSALEGTEYMYSEENGLLSYASTCGTIDVVATIDGDGGIKVLEEDVEIKDSFDLFFRIQW